MSDEVVVDPKTRKTITMTHKQAGFTFGGLTSFFAILHFLSANYASRADVKALAEQVSDVKVVVKDGFANQKADLVTHTADEAHKHERIVDILRKEIGDEKSDRIRDDDGVSKRIDLVMELFKIKKTKTN